MKSRIVASLKVRKPLLAPACSSLRNEESQATITQ